MNEKESVNYQQPVAYDSDGRPLYAAPQPAPTQQTVVHVARPLEPIEQEISPEAKARHDDSVKRYPHLNLSEGEYVINAIRRHPIGLFLPIAITSVLVIMVIVMMIAFPLIMDRMYIANPPAFELITVLGGILLILFAIGGYVAVWVYLNNGFYLTNESVVQEIQNSIFSRREQTVSLGNIEDASYTQSGILQSLLDYGSIRLSTEGDETTYRFHYVANPKKQIAILNNAVEAFKNGRPVNDE